MPIITLDYNNTKIDDTYVFSSQPTVNGKGQSAFYIGPNYEALVRFNMGLIPNNAIINSARLDLTLNSSQLTSNRGLELRTPLTDWNIDTVTWDTRPSVPTEAEALAVIPHSTAKFSIDVTAFAQKWVNGQNYGIHIVTDKEATSSSTISSSENTVVDNRPKLVIDYSIPETGKKQVELKVSKTHSVNTAAHNIPLTDLLPAKIDIGDTLVAYINTAFSVTDLIIPDGWTLVTVKRYSETNNNAVYVLSRKIDGTEGTLLLKRTSDAMFSVGAVIAFYRNLKNIKVIGEQSISSATPKLALSGVPEKSLFTLITAHTGTLTATRFSINFRTGTLGTSGGMSLALADTYNYNKTSYAADETTVTYSGSITGTIQALALEPYTNQAPNTPPTNNPRGTQTAPAILATDTPTFDWSFSDPDVGDAQSKYQVRIKKASDASIIHDTGVVTSAVTDYTVPAGIIKKNELYYWEVQAHDSQGAASSWSSPEYFKLTDQATAGDVFTFNYTGAAQPFTVPGNVKKVRLEAWGAQGGRSLNTEPLIGKGGYAKGDLAVTAGEVLELYVGGKGADFTTGLPNPPGGWNGGGTGGKGANYSGGGGGGATDIRKGGTALANRILVAAGGGGVSGAVGTSGPHGGGLEGVQGHSGGGTGGTQTAGGKTGTTGGGTDGTIGVGGTGGSSVYAAAGGGGGGGGYYGGGGGNTNGSPGGGGSSYIGTLESGETIAGQREGDGLVKITVLEVSNPPTVINRDPGTTDQLQPEGSSMAPLFTWDYSGDFIQAKYRVKVFDNKELLVHDSGLVTSTEKFYQVPSGTLEGGKTYSWELTVTDVNNVSYLTPRLYFITNQPPGAVVPENPIDNYRTGLRPTFWGTIGNDVEDDPQKFVIQIAEDSSFTQNVQERNSETSAGDWQVKTKDGVYGPLLAEGVDASYEGGTVKYTWSAELTEGKTYYWRMAGIDATTGARGTWSTARRVRVGNRIDVSLKNPVATTAAIHRLLIRAQYTLATDGVNPATVKFEACNNAFDENPTWEDVTDDIKTGEYHIFTNDQKTAENWGFNIRAIFEANDSLDPIEFYGFGISFD